MDVLDSRKYLCWVPPRSLRGKVLVEAHEGAGHFGQQATLDRLHAAYWWPGLWAEACEHVKKCKVDCRH